jgi:hypothetical protein
MGISLDLLSCYNRNVLTKKTLYIRAKQKIRTRKTGLAKFQSNVDYFKFRTKSASHMLN